MNPTLARAGTAGLPPSTETWALDHARELYRVEAWGDAFFAVNELGHAAVRPLGTDVVTIDLTKVVAALERQGVAVPFLIRFQDILRQRVQQISGAFSVAIADAAYDGRYCPVYPIKVNQLHEVEEEELDAGKTVVSDRYLLANVVYQGHAGGLDIDTLWQVGHIATDYLIPDLTIVLDLPSEAAAARLTGELDRMEKQGEAFHAGVRQGFLTEAERQGDHNKVVDASRSIDEVAAEIQATAEAAMAKSS